MKKIVIISLLGIAIILFSLLYIIEQTSMERDDKRNEISKVQVENELKYMERFKDKDGNYILNLDEPRFFLEEKEGYDYRKPIIYEYLSQITGTNRQLKVMLPKDYNSKKPYPLLILLHGHLGNRDSWIEKRGYIMIENMIYFQNLQDMIVVFYDSNLNNDNQVKNLDYYNAVSIFDKTKDDIFNSLIPSLEKSYNIDLNQDKHYVAGLSLGGRNALALGNENLYFGMIGAFSPEEINLKGGKKLPVLIDSLNYDVLKDKYLEISTGNKDDDTMKGTLSIKEELEKNALHFNYYTLEGGHEPKVWIVSLYNFLNRIREVR